MKNADRKMRPPYHESGGIRQAPLLWGACPHPWELFRGEWKQFPGFGDTLHNNIHEWFYDEENLYVWEVLQQMLHIEKRTAEDNKDMIK